MAVIAGRLQFEISRALQDLCGEGAIDHAGGAVLAIDGTFLSIWRR